MNTIKWSADMRVGQPRMDDAHEALFRELEAVQVAEDSRFCEVFCSVVARFEAEFREEERLMEEIDYPGLHAHREQHARVLATLHQSACKSMLGDHGTARRAVELLPHWFLMHLGTMDTALALALELCDADAAFLQERQVS